LFLQEKYAIGQVFVEIGRTPRFELVEVGIGSNKWTERTGRGQLWRKYKLEVEGFECDILEVFPDRKMFIQGEEWLMKGTNRSQFVFTLREIFQHRSRRQRVTVVIILLLSLACGLTVTFGIF
jgi:hypothetical protein